MNRPEKPDRTVTPRPIPRRHGWHLPAITMPAVLFLLLPAGAIAAPAQASLTPSPVPGMVLVSTNQLAAMQKEEDDLRHENALLRKENRALRRQLVRRDKTPIVGEQAKETSQTAEDATEEHWISPTGKRHNSRCRYFKQGNGKPCDADDGEPCKICGG